MQNNVVRLMFCAFERDRFLATSVQGCRLLHAMLNVLPDNKIVEDAHNDIRKDTKRTGGMKKTFYVSDSECPHARAFVREARDPTPSKYFAGVF